jgi:hypothetical protein
MPPLPHATAVANAHISGSVVGLGLVRRIGVVRWFVGLCVLRLSRALVVQRADVELDLLLCGDHILVVVIVKSYPSAGGGGPSFFSLASLRSASFSFFPYSTHRWFVYVERALGPRGVACGAFTAGRVVATID